MLTAKQFVVRGGITPKKAQHYGVAKLSGEIDALCIDDARSRIWVVEAKDPYTPYSARQVRRLIDDFIAPGKYIDRLLRKASDITDSASSIAAALNIEESRRTWTVVPLMVTRHLEPAAYAVDPRVPFCVLHNLGATVDQDELPRPGLPAYAGSQ